MKIVVIGAGEVGRRVAEDLSSDGHDVTIVEMDPTVVEKVEDELDVRVVKGNGSRPPVLERAGIYPGCDTDILIACSNRDEVNIMACWLAKRSGVGQVISRARGMEYTDTPTWASELGIDVMNSPERSVAKEIEELLEIRAAVHMSEMLEGKAGLYAFRVSSDSPLEGKSLSQLGTLYPDLTAKMVYVERGGKGIVPAGEWVSLEGDLCFVVSLREQIKDVQALFNVQRERTLRRVIIVGGGKLGSHLARGLEKRYSNIDIRLIDRDMEKCERLAEEFERTIVLCGDGTDEKLLLHEGVEGVDGFVTATDDDESNLLIAILAKTLGARKSIAVVRRGVYVRLGDHLPLDAIVDPNQALASVIMRHVRYPKGTSSLSIIERIGAEMLEVIIPEDSPAVGTSLAAIKLPGGVLIALVERDGAVFIPGGNTFIEAKDRLFIFASSELMSRAVMMLGVDES